MSTEKSLLHFNCFSGVFTKISNEDGKRINFSVFDKHLNKSITKCYEELKKRQQQKRPGARVMEINNCSNFCLDENDNIYVFLLVKKKGTQQKLFVFSKTGDFLYWTQVPYFNSITIKNIFYLEGTFAFLTYAEDLFFTKKK